MVKGWTKEDIYLVAEHGHALHNQGRYREAVVVFEGLVAIDPTDAYCRKALAAAHLARGHAESALDPLNAVLARDPRDLDALARRCEAYLELEQVDEAKRDWVALKRHGDSADVRRLGLMLETALADVG